MTERTTAQYDAWYCTDRGAWIGELEYRLLVQQLRPQQGERLVDVGCAPAGLRVVLPSDITLASRGWTLRSL